MGFNSAFKGLLTDDNALLPTLETKIPFSKVTVIAVVGLSTHSAVRYLLFTTSNYVTHTNRYSNK